MSRFVRRSTNPIRTARPDFPDVGALLIDLIDYDLSLLFGAVNVLLRYSRWWARVYISVAEYSARSLYVLVHYF